jgi:hypothetical protein
MTNMISARLWVAALVDGLVLIGAAGAQASHFGELQELAFAYIRP